MITLTLSYQFVRSNFSPQKHLTGDSKRNFCDDFQTPPSIEWMVMFYFQFNNFVLTWLWSSPSFQRLPAYEIFINCKTVFGGYFDQKNSFFFPTKKVLQSIAMFVFNCFTMIMITPGEDGLVKLHSPDTLDYTYWVYNQICFI